MLLALFGLVLFFDCTGKKNDDILISLM